MMSVVKKEPFGQRIIRDIKMSDAKLWFIKLYDDGYSYSTIASIRGVVNRADCNACTEDIIRRNPFEFRLDIIPNNTQKRVALSPKQQEQFLEFTKNDKHFCRYLDEIKILLGTGMRISELCGLTIANMNLTAEESVWIMSWSEHRMENAILRKQKRNVAVATYQ